MSRRIKPLVRAYINWMNPPKEDSSSWYTDSLENALDIFLEEHDARIITILRCVNGKTLTNEQAFDELDRILEE